MGIGDEASESCHAISHSEDTFHSSRLTPDAPILFHYVTIRWWHKGTLMGLSISMSSAIRRHDKVYHSSSSFAMQ